MSAARPQGLEDILPLTPLQEAIVYHSTRPRAAGETDPYLILADLDLGPAADVDTDVMQRAIDTVVRRHASLRTSYTRRRTGQPVARVHGAVEVPLSYQELDATSDIAAVHADQRSLGVSLASPPPVRFVLVTDRPAGGTATSTLVMVAHHVAVDGWSIHRVLEEIVAGYTGVELPPVQPISTFLGWLTARPADTEVWTRTLSGFRGPTRLPLVDQHLTGKPSESIPSRSADHRLSAERSSALRSLAHRSGATLNTLIQVSWALVLADLTDSDDIVFGAVVSGRHPAVLGVDEMVGMLINTIPVRVRLDPSETPTRLLARVQREQLALLDHQHTALGDIQAAMGMGELFDSVVVFESFPRGSVRPVIDDENTYSATLIVEDDPEIRLVFERRGVDPRLLDSLVGLLGALADAGDVPVGRLPRSGSDGVDQGAGRGLAGHNAGHRQAPIPALPFRPVAARIAEMSAQAGRRLAVVAGDTRISYREFETTTARFAAALDRRGIRAESMVAIALHRTPAAVAMLVAVMRTGGTYLPIDPAYPADRIAFMLADANPDLVVDDAVLADIVAETTDDPSTMPVGAIRPDAAAYLVYTSGSTGLPKGVVGTAGALANRIGWAARHWDATTVLAKSSFAFIDGTTELFGALAAGATVVLADDTTSRDAGRLSELAVATGADQITAVPSLAHAMVDAAEPTALPLRPHRWIVSGEPMTSTVVERLHTSAAEVVNSYGSSEVAGDVATGIVTGPVHIGTAVPGARLWVLDRRLRPVPSGVPGELYVAGVQLARGYHRRPDETAARFVAATDGSGARMYRSGDRAVLAGDGTLHLLGRNDGQVKIRGNRVELGEVEAALAAIGGVDAAVVVAGRSDDGQGEVAVRLDAYLTGSADTADVAARLRARLPAFMIPSTWTRLDSLPLTPGGKIDRRALPTPDTVRRTGRRRPTNDLERAVVGIVADVLGIPEPGLDDDFFDLGGHSLSATRVLTRLRVTTDAVLTVAQVFDHPVLSQIVDLVAGELEAAPSASDGSTTAPDEPAALDVRPSPLPLSPAQRRLWFQSGVDDAAYTIPFAVRLTGEPDRNRLVTALRGIVRRHEALRTRIVDGAQIIDPPSAADDLGLGEIAVGGVVGDADTTAAIDALIARPFDLTADLPIRADLLGAVGSTESATSTMSRPSTSILLITVHHIAADEWSAGRLFDELAAGYNGLEVAPPPIQFADHTVWQLQRLGSRDEPGSRAYTQLEFWRRELSGAPEELDLPVDRPRGADRGHGGDEIVRVIDAERLTRLRARARDGGATMFMVTHAAVAVAISASGAGHDIVVGTPVAGRSAASADRMIGMFVNTLTLRTDLSGNPDLAGVLARVRTADLAAYDHQDVPFDEVVTALAPNRSLARHPLFQTMVQYRDPIVAPDFDGLTAVPLFPRTTTSKFDLTFEFAELADGAGIRLRLEYATELFDRRTADELAGRVTAVLDLLAAAPGTRMADLRLTTPQSLPGVASSRAFVGADLRIGRTARTLVDIMSTTFGRSGERTAVVAGGERLTYAEIDRRSAALAHRLIADGVGPGDLVALRVPRSADLVIALLAILRTGAAYVPIDPDHPAERVTGIIEDAHPRLIVDGQYLAATATDRSESATLPEIGPDHLAYVIFTSGSTGRPKGVTVTHGNVVALLDATDGLFDVTADDVWTMFHSYAFDFSVWELWGPLSTGACIVIPDRSVTRAPDEFGALLAAERVSVLSQTPSAFFALDAAVRAGGDVDLSALRYVIFGGEALDLRRLPDFMARHPHVTPVNMYGITETTVHASHLTVDEKTARTAPGSDIGALLPGFSGAVLDEYLRPVPDGASGELYLAGPQVAPGYLNRPSLTAARFVADPGSHGGVLYRTGDLVRRTTDGRLLYQGRSDTQVKVRGFRIELGEIRSALAALDAVDDVAVITRPGPDGNDRILAYVVGDSLDPAAVRAGSSSRLPEHMVPAAVVVLDAIPLTVNGKTDTSALPDPDLSSVGGRRPTSDLERALADVFADSLGIERDQDGLPAVSVDDDFFALGGDSIVSTTMVNRARRRGLQLTPRDVFTHRTIEGLAAVTRWIDDDPEADRDAAGPGSDATRLAAVAVPLLPVVHRLRELGGPIARFNQSLVVDTPVDADRASLEAALQSIIDTHEALRMTLTVVAGVVWSLEAGPPGTVSAAEVLEVVPHGTHTDVTTAVRIESGRAAGRLDPTAGTMLAATFLEPCVGDRGRLVLVIHHLAVDGVSRRILLDDLASFHADAAAGLAPTPLPETTTLHDFAAVVAARADDPALLNEATHWATVLAPGADLIPGAPPSGGQVGDQRHQVVTLDAETTSVLMSDTPARLGVGITSVFIGALRMAATQVFETADLLIDTERHGRDTEGAGLGDLDLSHTVGWFTTVAPLRLPVCHDLSAAVSDAERLWREIPSAGAGFGMLRYLNPQLSAALAGLSRASVLINYLGRFPVGGGMDWQPSAESTSLAATPDDGLGCGYPLEIDIVCRDETDGPVLAATFAHLPDQLSSDSVRALAGAWRAALESLSAPIDSGAHA
ncbi:amino acid adenylation domain-containing protein [Gordonia sp. ABSL11-1]|uniref:non-ribosomal peptide synthetase n=1 Tax=Gordonia sp. ABSL11-1 TaxID=3053924 RepID=UPI0025748D26|nr:non-ribosomal peptide synthetase [Gordonia sp. ABSL11-1]MDL9946105.1 amino acid adenylation domain-containing protein [Gordonia sp. ABSL11-1]